MQELLLCLGRYTQNWITSARPLLGTTVSCLFFTWPFLLQKFLVSISGNREMPYITKKGRFHLRNGRKKRRGQCKIIFCKTRNWLETVTNLHFLTQGILKFSCVLKTNKPLIRFTPMSLVSFSHIKLEYNLVIPKAMSSTCRPLAPAGVACPELMLTTLVAVR